MSRRRVVEVFLLIGLCSSVACSKDSDAGDDGSTDGSDGTGGATGDGGATGTGGTGGTNTTPTGTGSLEQQLCEALWECSMLEGGYSIQDCTDILESCTAQLLTSEKTEWENAVEACLDLPLCQAFVECALGIDPCGIPGDDPGTDTSTSGGGCVPTGGECIMTNGDCCGFPDTDLCVDWGPGYGAHCSAICEENGDCASDCCLPLEQDGSVCGPEEFCP